jgi:hypothetical protein
METYDRSLDKVERLFAGRPEEAVVAALEHTIRGSGLEAESTGVRERARRISARERSDQRSGHHPVAGPARLLLALRRREWRPFPADWLLDRRAPKTRHGGGARGPDVIRARRDGGRQR